MISSDIMRGYNEVLILSILREKDNYGYMISKEIARKCNNEYVIKEATLYAVLLRLEKRKLVHSYKGEVTCGKERTYFNITDEGFLYLKEKCDEWSITKKVLDSILLGR